MPMSRRPRSPPRPAIIGTTAWFPARNNPSTRRSRQRRPNTRARRQLALRLSHILFNRPPSLTLPRPSRLPRPTAPDEPAAAAAVLAPTTATAAPRPASPRPAAAKANQKIASQGGAPETSQVGQSPVGRYMIQISASTAREDAIAALKAAQSKYPDVLRGQQSQVREKKLADKTPLFTAQFGPLASRAEAAELCQRLKSAGGSCYVP